MSIRLARGRALRLALVSVLALGTALAPGSPAQASATTIYSTLVMASSPLAYYRLGESSGTTMSDSSGNAHHGSYLASVTLGQPAATSNTTDTAVLFTTGRGSAPGVAAPQTAYTLEAWIKRTSNADGQIVGHAGGGQLFVQGDHLGISQSGTTFVDATTTLAANTWYHVAATWNGTTTTLYVNGSPVAATGTANTAPAASGTLYVGSGTVPLLPRFTGTLDEVAYYPTALSQAVLDDHWKVGQDTVAPDIVITGPSDKGLYILHAPLATPNQTCPDPAVSSGLASCTASSSGSGILGPRTFTVDALDRAGNSSTRTIGYTIVPNRYADEVLLSSPLAYYRLGDPVGATTLTDHSGHGNDGTYKNGVAPGGRRPAAIACQRRPDPPRVCEPAADPKDFATHFGGNGYAFVDDLVAPQAAYTLEAWVRPDAGVTDGAIVGQGGAGQLYLTGGRLALRQTQDDVVSANPALTPGTWWHVAATWDGTTTRLYVNGTLVGSSTTALKAPSGSATTYVGLGENAPPFQGDLDEVAYYGQALSAGVLAEHHAVGTAYDWASLPPMPPGPNTGLPTGVIITPAVDALYAPTKTPTADFACDDADGPGDVVSCTAKVDGNPINVGDVLPDMLGSHTFAITATDTAGNVDTHSVTYTVMSFAAIYGFDAPLAYYRLGDAGAVMADASGHGHHGDYKNRQESGPIGISGDLDTARRFWGDGGHGFANDISAGEFQSTLEAWVNPDDLRDQSIAGLAGTDELYVTGGRFAFRHLDRTVTAAVGPTPGVFRQVVGVWDGTTIAIYVDGVLSGTAEAATGRSSGGGTFYVGFGTRATWFLGSLDEVAYYGTALSPGRVLEHFLADPPPPVRCVVPALRGLRIEAAERRLEAEGCSLGRVTRRDAAPSRRGEVIRQSVAPSTTLRTGRAVRVTVGR